MKTQSEKESMKAKEIKNNVAHAQSKILDIIKELESNNPIALLGFDIDSVRGSDFNHRTIGLKVNYEIC